jgi:hypothetical protein
MASEEAVDSQMGDTKVQAISRAGRCSVGVAVHCKAKNRDKHPLTQPMRLQHAKPNFLVAALEFSLPEDSNLTCSYIHLHPEHHHRC